LRRAFAGTMFSFICSLMLVTPALAIDLRHLPDWIRLSIEPVHINWAEVYPGLVSDVSAVSVGGEELQTLQSVGSTGASTVSVGGGDLQTVQGIGTAGEPQIGGVHGISLEGELRGVSLGQKGKPIVIPEPARTRGYALLLTWKDLMQQGKLDEETRRAWIAEHNVDRATLIEALDNVRFSLPVDPIYLPICAALWDKIGTNIEAYLEFPYSARMIMAIYLGVLEREEDAKKLLSSLSNPDKMALGADLYRVANELLGYQNKSYRLAIWAHKRGAMMRGPADQAWVCFLIMQECRKLGDPEVVREELIPWAEEALARPGSEVAVPPGTPGGGGSRWRYAVRELIWAYDYVGEPQKALERGEYWFQQAKERNVSPQDLLGARLQLAEAYANAGKAKDAAQILQALLAPDASPSSWLVRRAQTQLIELATLHPEIGDVGLPAPQLERISPDRPILRVRVGDKAPLTIQVVGNTTFRVNKAHCTVPFVQTAVYWGPSRQDKSVQVIVLSVEPTEKALKEEGTLIIETNDAEKPEVEVPIVIEVVNPPQ